MAHSSAEFLPAFGLAGGVPMADKKYVVPETLAILPVRDTVLFPGAVLPLTVGRESSLALVNSLSGEEKLLGVVAQLDPRIEDPAAADLHKVGTLAKVHKTVKMPNGNVVVFLEGLQRIRINELLDLRPFLRAAVASEPDILGDDDNELEALERNAQDLFRDVVSHSPQLSDDLQNVAMNIDDARQHQQTPRIEFRTAATTIEASDTPILQQHIGCLFAVRTQQHPPAGDPQSVHRVRSQGSKTICTRGVG